MGMPNEDDGRANEGKDEGMRAEQEAGEVEVPPGKHPPSPTALAKHSEEHNNKVGAHKAVHAATLAVEPLLNNAAPGTTHHLLPFVIGHKHPKPIERSIVLAILGVVN
jgi:hypothetical protein